MPEFDSGLYRLFGPPVITEEGLEETLTLARLLTWSEDLRDMKPITETIQ